jgi:hypothetical protein
MLGHGSILGSADDEAGDCQSADGLKTPASKPCAHQASTGFGQVSGRQTGGRLLDFLGRAEGGSGARDHHPPPFPKLSDIELSARLPRF